MNSLESLIGLRTDIFCRRLLLGYFRASSGDEILRIARSEFVAHYEHIRDIVPPERLLNRKLGTGWGPLYQFLSKEEPQEEFPRLNDEQVMKEMIVEGTEEIPRRFQEISHLYRPISRSRSSSIYGLKIRIVKE